MSQAVNIDSFLQQLEQLKAAAYNNYTAAKNSNAPQNELYFRGEWNGLNEAMDAAKLMLVPPPAMQSAQSAAPAQPGETPRASTIRVRGGFGSADEIEKENAEATKRSKKR